MISPPLADLDCLPALPVPAVAADLAARSQSATANFHLICKSLQCEVESAVQRRYQSKVTDYRQSLVPACFFPLCSSMRLTDLFKVSTLLPHAKVQNKFQAVTHSDELLCNECVTQSASAFTCFCNQAILALMC